MKIKADHYFTLKETHNQPKGVNLEEVPYQGDTHGGNLNVSWLLDKTAVSEVVVIGGRRDVSALGRGVLTPGGFSRAGVD